MNWDYYSCHSFQNQGNLNQKEVHNYFNSKLNASHYLAPSFHEYLIVGEILFYLDHLLDHSPDSTCSECNLLLSFRTLFWQ